MKEGKLLQKILPHNVMEELGNAASIPCPNFFQLFSLLCSLPQLTEKQQQHR